MDETTERAEADAADHCFRGELAIVTGAGAGIGRSVAKLLAARGAKVLIAERDAVSGADAASEIREAGGIAESLQVAVGDADAVHEMIGWAEASEEPLRVLVNNAAVTRSSQFFEVSGEEWDTILDVNSKGLFFLMQAAAATMTNRGGGRIVNIASIAGKGWGGSSSAASAGSKGAVIALTRYAALALAGEGVNVNCVCPGITQTDVLERLLRERAADAGVEFDRYVSDYAAQIPVGRMNQPEDVAEAVAFLASPRARNITGQSLNVDGGLVLD